MTKPGTALPRIAGLLLAAGSGKRFGGPKALADTGTGPWVLRALATLESLAPRIVVVGAAGEQVRALLPTGVLSVANPDHASGMGSSLATGLRAVGASAESGEPGASGASGESRISPSTVDAVVVMLVDLPDVPAAAVRRVVDCAVHQAIGGDHPGGDLSRDHVGGHLSGDLGDGPGGDPSSGDVRAGVRRSLVRATYHGEPGHPVLFGADHFSGILAAAVADRGARDYLASHPVTNVECGDLADGHDQDTRPTLGSGA